MQKMGSWSQDSEPWPRSWYWISVSDGSLPACS